MEEEVGIKVTRLRRRLSVEADDVKSPSTQSTPTKKRGGRLAAKPQLELIDENASEAAPKRTRKSIVKEAQPVEEKAVTPSRRSTRIKSNTSIVSETPDVAEDKGTPSRRNTRIKSNTSLVAEPVNVNSPRAKRAARRTSQVGSDNEAPAPITPARMTRRTRNNSTSSIDKPVETTGKLGGEIKEVIAEESEINGKETKKSTERSQNDSPSLRKSPRLNGKSGKSSSLDNDNKENEPRSGKEASETTAAADKSLSELKPEQTTDVTDNKAPEQINLSVASKNLIQELEEAPKKSKPIFNKSTTAIEEPQIKTKRNRTKSWTTISTESPQESNFCSDSETTKKRNKKKNDTLNFSNISGSGDGIMNTSNKNDEADKEQDVLSQNSSTLSNKKKKKRHEISLTAETETIVHDVSVFNTSVNKSAAKLSEAKELSKDINEELNSSKKLDTSGTQNLFDQAPTGIVQSLVFIEDSDSNNEKGFDSGDQCVPVADHQTVEDESSKNPQINLSYEPMDIDETMPENISLTNFVDKNNSTSEKRKSILNISQVTNDSFNKSKRKSVISKMVSEDNIEEASTKSPWKSTISEIVVNDDGDNNKSKRKSSINNQVTEDTTDGIFNDSSRKSLVIDMVSHDESINKKDNKSKRKSSISNPVTEQNADEDSDNSTSKSLSADKSYDESLDKEANKSKKNSSLSNIVSDEMKNDISNKSTRKSSVTELAIDENMDKSLNKSKRKSLLSNIVSDEMTNDISNKSSRKSTVTELAIDENMDNSLNKSKRKSLTAMAVEVTMNNIKTSILDDDDRMANKSSNKSKRKSSILNTPGSDSMDKSSDKTESNENKSTLVLSQLKDVSENEINTESSVSKDSSDSNEQLSKSVNVATEKATDKKNLSLTYSTSTPLQQKCMKKLALQINSSIIAPNSANKVDKNNTPNKSKKEASIMSEEDGSDSSEEEEEDAEDDVEDESEEESSDKKSQIIDDEAEEASEDYESGDSRDEDEKEYEEQNEIREKGETLDSDEEDLSDDSDYEKDSFIVSSDAEDNDLLSGSGDDLSVSADELTMSAKSKKKFNERKIKEQKKASREMYEARHKLNVSDKSEKSPKSKKNNRQRFDTSSSESEKEVVTQPQKNRRQRIDSSHDASGLKSDTDKSLSKKKKAKRLSESVCDEDETNEKEITIRLENPTEKDDPLTLLNVIKEEPKTPQKSLNISTVAVTDMDEEEDVEEVDEVENVSIMKSNQTSDPLQATMAENDEEDDTDQSLISENEEITQNYESVLSNLNKSVSKKIKASNISLDLNKKTMQKAKEPIVDQLNLTQVKTSKKKKGDSAVTKESKKQDKSLNKSIDIVAKKGIQFSEGSSDSIDMKLLFTEDSNDSEIVLVQKEEAVKETTPKEHDEEAPGEFIPLKRSQGKTNILENMDTANTFKNESILKITDNKKQKSFIKQNDLRLFFQKSNPRISPSEFDQFGYFIDTTGTLSDGDKSNVDTLIKISAKKNKQKNNVSFGGRGEIPVDDDSNDAPLEISYRNEKNKSKQALNTTQNSEAIPEDNVAVGTPNQSAKKKKNKKGLNSSQNEISVIEATDDVPEKSVNISMTNVEGSAKKKKKRLSKSQTAPESETPIVPTLNSSLGSAKKQKKKTISESTAMETPTEPTLNVSLGSAKKQKKKSISESTATETPTEPTLNVSLGSAKKQKKKTISESTPTETPTEPTLNVSLGSAKKQKKKTISESTATETPAEPTLNVSLGSAKKQKQRTISENTGTETPAVPTLNISLGSAKKQKQKTTSESTAPETENVNKENEEVINQELATKKRKRKPSANQTIDEIIIKDDVKLTNVEPIPTKNQKKKRKISNNDEGNKLQNEDLVPETKKTKNTPVENTKKKSKLQHRKEDEIGDGPTKKNKKRKERDDDDASEISKVLKQNSFDKVHVPRLPSNVLKQLDDKPKKEEVETKKTKVVSTSEFAVEETKRRRNKPSNYLEESIYCINDDIEEKKQKRSIKNPKVLPFIPTASTSDSGFTTNFRVNVISQQTQFIAQSSDVSNFKNDYLQKKRIKKLGTFEMYKRQRNIKIAKF